MMLNFLLMKIVPFLVFKHLNVISAVWDVVSIGKLVSAGVTYMCDRSTQTLQQWYTGTRHCMVHGTRLWTCQSAQWRTTSILWPAMSLLCFTGQEWLLSPPSHYRSSLALASSVLAQGSPLQVDVSVSPASLPAFLDAVWLSQASSSAALNMQSVFVWFGCALWAPTRKLVILIFQCWCSSKQPFVSLAFPKCLLLLWSRAASPESHSCLLGRWCSRHTLADPITSFGRGLHCQASLAPSAEVRLSHSQHPAWLPGQKQAVSVPVGSQCIIRKSGLERPRVRDSSFW